MSTNRTPALRLIRYAHAFLGGCVLAFVLFVAANTFLITSFTVDGHSMEPTLHNGQLLGISLASYLAAAPRIGDIVIVAYQGDRSVRFVKRIEGLPGDEVVVQGEPVVLGPDQYYVIGDNRDHSTDSRTYGPVGRDQIIGRVILR